SWAPGFIFTTSLSPVLAAGVIASIDILKGDEGRALRARHQERASTLRRLFKEAALPIIEAPSHIVPVLVCDPVHTKLVSDLLLEDHGIYVQPINYPTVPRGTERLRFTPSPLHDDAMMADLVGVMDRLWAKCNVARQPAAA